MRTILATYTEGHKGGTPLGGAVVEIPDEGSVVPLVREQSTATGCANDGYLHWVEMPPASLEYVSAVPRHQWLTVEDLRRYHFC